MNDEYFMQIALKKAKKALLSGEFPVGCVLVYQDRVIAVGSRQGTAGGSYNETDHAEIVALRRLTKSVPDMDLRHVSAYTTLEPCLMCFGAMMIHGIGRLVYAYEDVMGGGTMCDISSLPTLYSESDMSIVPGVLRNDSRMLLKIYFQNPKNAYWKGSLLAESALS